MPRLLFVKKGNSIWISHLDLMRVFQRSFKRAGLPLIHTQGFNPRPSVSIALPLSVGIESYCELLDFDLDSEGYNSDDILSSLNKALIDGVEILDVYTNGRKIRDIAYLHTEIDLYYDRGVPAGAATAISELFKQDVVLVTKKTKNGEQEQNIVSMIRTFSVAQAGEQALKISVVHCCQNPSLNPMQIPAAIEKYLPNYKADFCKYRRVEIFDQNNQVFR